MMFIFISASTRAVRRDMTSSASEMTIMSSSARPSNSRRANAAARPSVSCSQGAACAHPMSSDADASLASDADNSYDEVEESVVRDAALLDLDADVGRAWDALPPGSMLVLVTGVGNAPKVKTLQERKWKRAQALGPWGKWTDEAEAELRLEAERARRGMLFAAVKND